MDYIKKGKQIIIKKMKDFSVGDTLECGQCFRYEKCRTDQYICYLQDQRTIITEENEKLIFETGEEAFHQIWAPYFDLARDYTQIKETLQDLDPVMARAITFAPGIHILRQDPWETLISFIVSQNNHIPRIKQIMKMICASYGNKSEDGFYSFPSPEELSKVTELELRECCKTGFRAKYIADAVEQVYSGKIELNRDGKDVTGDRDTLMGIYGVGRKVADCVLLYGMGYTQVFPVDVWVNRIVGHLYFNGKKVPLKEVYDFAEEHFGVLAGFAQQYLFHYAKELKIGK